MSFIDMLSFGLLLLQTNLFQNTNQQLIYVVLDSYRSLYELGIASGSQPFTLWNGKEELSPNKSNLRSCNSAKQLVARLSLITCSWNDPWPFQINFVCHKNHGIWASIWKTPEVTEDLLCNLETGSVDDWVDNHHCMRLVSKHGVFDLHNMRMIIFLNNVMGKITAEVYDTIFLNIDNPIVCCENTKLMMQ